MQRAFSTLAARRAAVFTGSKARTRANSGVRRGKYIWAILPGREGELYIATGEPGRVYRLAPGAATADLYYDTGQANVTALALARTAICLPVRTNGRLNATTGANKATVLSILRCPRFELSYATPKALFTRLPWAARFLPARAPPPPPHLPPRPRWPHRPPSSP